MTVITCEEGSLPQRSVCPQIPLRRTGRGRLRLRVAGAVLCRRGAETPPAVFLSAGVYGGLKTSWNKKKGKKRRKARLPNRVGIGFFSLYVIFFLVSSPSAVLFSSFFSSPRIFPAGAGRWQRAAGCGLRGAHGPGTFSPGSFYQSAPTRGRARSSHPTETCTRERSFSAAPKVTFGEVSTLSLRAAQGLHLKLLGCQRSPKLNLCLTLFFSSPFILEISRRKYIFSPLLFL